MIESNTINNCLNDCSLKDSPPIGQAILYAKNNKDISVTNMVDYLISNPEYSIYASTEEEYSSLAIVVISIANTTSN